METKLIKAGDPIPEGWEAYKIKIRKIPTTPQEGWINVYKSERDDKYFTALNIYPTEDAAINDIKNYDTSFVVATLKIEWKE